jgi:hypothetical protein
MKAHENLVRLPQWNVDMAKQLHFKSAMMYSLQNLVAEKYE